MSDPKLRVPAGLRPPPRPPPFDPRVRPQIPPAPQEDEDPTRRVPRPQPDEDDEEPTGVRRVMTSLESEEQSPLDVDVSAEDLAPPPASPVPRAAEPVTQPAAPFATVVAAGPPDPGAIDLEEGDEAPVTPRGVHRELWTPRRIGLALGVFLFLLLAIGLPFGGGDLGDACGDVEGELAGAWADPKREAVRAAVTATKLGYAESTWERLGPRLDAYASAWRDARRGACAALQQGERSAEVHALESACLQRRLSAMGALVEGLAAADARAVERAIAATGGLPAPAGCKDVAALAAIAPPEAKVAAEVAALRGQVASLRAGQALGKTAETRMAAAPVLLRARELGYTPLAAEVTGVVGELQRDAGDLEVAKVSLTEAVWLADQVRDDALLAEHLSSLIVLVGDGGPSEAEEALRWRRHADAVRARLPPDAPGQVGLLAAVGAALTRSDPAEAIGLLERAVTMVEAKEGLGDPRHAGLLLALGDAQLSKGDATAARGSYEKALAAHERLFGPAHPGRALILGRLAALVARSGDTDGALAQAQKAVELLETSGGKEHPDLAQLLAQLGALLAAKKDLAGARAALERAATLLEGSLGSEHPALAATLLELGRVAAELDDDAAARGALERAVTIGEKSLATDDPRLASLLGALGALELRAEKAKVALPLLERAYAIREPLAERVAPAELAEGRFRLAVALRALRREAERQTALASAALAGLRAEGPQRHAAQIAEIEAWLGDAAPTKKSVRPKKGKKKKKR